MTGQPGAGCFVQRQVGGKTGQGVEIEAVGGGGALRRSVGRRLLPDQFEVGRLQRKTIAGRQREVLQLGFKAAIEALSRQPSFKAEQIQFGQIGAQLQADVGQADIGGGRDQSLVGKSQP